jgi:hypothetical protein
LTKKYFRKIRCRKNYAKNSTFTLNAAPWEPPESNPPPPFTSSNYKYIPFGYGPFSSVPTPTPSPTSATKPLGFNLSSLLLLAVAIVAACVFMAGLIVARKLSHQKPTRWHSIFSRKLLLIIK